MSFFTLPFFVFITLVAVLYFAVPKKARWGVLLLASYAFFWLNSEWLLLIHVLTTVITFLFGLAVEGALKQGDAQLQSVEADNLSKEEKKQLKANAKKKAHRWMIIGIILVLGILLFLKYYNFFAGTANHLLTHFGIEMPALRLLLPIGISFYSLQAIAYLVDIYRGKCNADRNLAKFMLFMSFFPQIVQGPIARYNQLANQLYEGHSFDYDRFTKGIQLILWGLMKKLIIADRIAIPTNAIFDNSANYSGGMILMAGIFYGIQVYTDFSGGMDIARGVSQMLGIELELNFRQPYFSRSIEDFWRRWHITLGGFMRDYIFYPLSLSKSFAKLGKKARKIFKPSFGKKLPSFLAMFIVYLLVGFWHGSSWKYIAFGLWNGFFIMMSIMLSDVYVIAKEKCRIQDSAFTWRLFQIGRTFFICSLGRLFSRADSLRIALSMFRSFPKDILDLSFLTNGTFINLGLNNANWYLLTAFILFLFFVDYLHERDVHIRDCIASQPIVFRWAIYIGAIMAIAVFGIYGPAYDSAGFIYEQF